MATWRSIAPGSTSRSSTKSTRRVKIRSGLRLPLLGSSRTPRMPAGTVGARASSPTTRPTRRSRTCKAKAGRANPVSYVTEDDPPFLIVHGEDDDMVPHHQSVTAVRSASRGVRGRPVHLAAEPPARAPLSRRPERVEAAVRPDRGGVRLGVDGPLPGGDVRHDPRLLRRVAEAHLGLVSRCTVRPASCACLFRPGTS
jgi:hypothetical protein